MFDADWVTFAIYCWRWPTFNFATDWHSVLGATTFSRPLSTGPSHLFQTLVNVSIDPTSPHHRKSLVQYWPWLVAVSVCRYLSDEYVAVLIANLLGLPEQHKSGWFTLGKPVTTVLQFWTTGPFLGPRPPRHRLAIAGSFQFDLLLLPTFCLKLCIQFNHLRRSATHIFLSQSY